jgi:hypothetical protein
MTAFSLFCRGSAVQGPIRAHTIVVMLPFAKGAVEGGEIERPIIRLGQFRSVVPVSSPHVPV